MTHYVAARGSQGISTSPKKIIWLNSNNLLKLQKEGTKRKCKINVPEDYWLAKISVAN
jgi:hypothetical protein